MYSSESKGQFLQKIWPLCAVLSKSGSGRGGTHQKKKKKKEARTSMSHFYVFMSHIYLCVRLLRLHMAFSAPCIFKLTTFILLFYLIGIVQVPSFRNKNVLEEKVWPCYRGKRAGKQSKGRALYKRHIITTLIRTRPLSRKAKPAASSSGHNRLTVRLFVSTPPRNLALLIRLCRLLCSRM